MENKINHAGLCVSKGQNRKIYHQLTGAISRDFNSVLQSYGWGFTGKEMSEASSYSGGHSNIRAVVDSLQANSLQRIVSSIQKMINDYEKGDAIEDVAIVDVGSKFSKIARVLSQFFDVPVL